MTTNEQGDYIFPELPLGAYRLTAQAKAFETFVREGLELHVQDKLRVDLSMTMGNMAETVTVTGAATLVRTEDATQANVINNQSIVDLPLNTRNFSQLAIMMPGVLPGIPGSTLGSFIGAGIGVGANGQREFNNAWNLDGANMNIGFYSWNSFNPSVDAIQEFTIQTALYPAEFGFQSGGNINIAIKSGTNQLHGTLYEFFQNNDMNGRNFFATSIPELRQNQFGGTIGGPIYIPKVYNGKDKTFFFFNYEGLRAPDSSPGPRYNAERGAADRRSFAHTVRNQVHRYDPRSAQRRSISREHHSGSPDRARRLKKSCRSSPYPTFLVRPATTTTRSGRNRTTPTRPSPESITASATTTPCSATMRKIPSFARPRNSFLRFLRPRLWPATTPPSTTPTSSRRAR